MTGRFLTLYIYKLRKLTSCMTNAKPRLFTKKRSQNLQNQCSRKHPKKVKTFAKPSKRSSDHKQWQALIESHFETKTNIRKIILDQSW